MFPRAVRLAIIGAWGEEVIPRRGTLLIATRRVTWNALYPLADQARTAVILVAIAFETICPLRTASLSS